SLGEIPAVDSLARDVASPHKHRMSIACRAAGWQASPVRVRQTRPAPWAEISAGQWVVSEILEVVALGGLGLHRTVWERAVFREEVEGHGRGHSTAMFILLPAHAPIRFAHDRGSVPLCEAFQFLEFTPICLGPIGIAGWQFIFLDCQWGSLDREPYMRVGRGA